LQAPDREEFVSERWTISELSSSCRIRAGQRQPPIMNHPRPRPPWVRHFLRPNDHQPWNPAHRWIRGSRPEMENAIRRCELRPPPVEATELLSRAVHHAVEGRGAETARTSLAEARAPVASVTCALSVVRPAALGDPLMAPVAECNDSPAGSDPLITDHT
jgi:hypothetical protein